MLRNVLCLVEGKGLLDAGGGERKIADADNNDPDILRKPLDIAIIGVDGRGSFDLGDGDDLAIKLDLGPRAFGAALLATGIEGLADRGGHFDSGALIEIHDLEGGILAEDIEIFRSGIARADKQLAQSRCGNDDLLPALFELADKKIDAFLNAGNRLPRFRGR